MRSLFLILWIFLSCIVQKQDKKIINDSTKLYSHTLTNSFGYFSAVENNELLYGIYQDDNTDGYSLLFFNKLTLSNSLDSTNIVSSYVDTIFFFSLSYFNSKRDSTNTNIFFNFDSINIKEIPTKFLDTPETIIVGFNDFARFIIPNFNNLLKGKKILFNLKSEGNREHYEFSTKIKTNRLQGHPSRVSEVDW